MGGGKEDRSQQVRGKMDRSQEVWRSEGRSEDRDQEGIMTDVRREKEVKGPEGRKTEVRRG